MKPTLLCLCLWVANYSTATLFAQAPPSKRFHVLLSHGISTNFLPIYTISNNRFFQKIDIGTSIQATLIYRLDESNQISFMYDAGLYLQKLPVGGFVTQLNSKQVKKSIYTNNAYLFLYRRGFLPKRNLWLVGGMGVFQPDKSYIITNQSINFQKNQTFQTLINGGVDYRIPFEGNVEFGIQAMISYSPSLKKLTAASLNPSLIIKF